MVKMTSKKRGEKQGFISVEPMGELESPTFSLPSKRLKE